LPFFTAATIRVAPCGGSATSLAGKSFHARVYLQTSVPFTPDLVVNDNQISAIVEPFPASGSDSIAQLFVGVAAGTMPTDTWFALDGTIPLGGTATQTIAVGVLLDNPPAGWTGGILFIDDVEIF